LEKSGGLPIIISGEEKCTIKDEKYYGGDA